MSALNPVLVKTATYLKALERENEALRRENAELAEARAWKRERDVTELLKTAEIAYSEGLVQDLAAMPFDDAQRVVQTMRRGKTSAARRLGAAAEDDARSTDPQDTPAAMFDALRALVS